METDEPKKSIGFLLSIKIQNRSLSTIQNELTVRSGEARQSSQVDRDFYFTLLKYSD